jgi:hypothetical protein
MLSLFLLNITVSVFNVQLNSNRANLDFLNKQNYKLFVGLHGHKTYNYLWKHHVKFITAKLSIRKPGSSSVLYNKHFII